MKIAIINNDKPQCGVFQMGNDIYEAMEEFSKHKVQLISISDRNDYLDNKELIQTFDVVIFNYHPQTLSWVTKEIVKDGPFVSVCINHEFDHRTAYVANSDLFKYRLAFDPSLPKRCPNLGVVSRLIPQNNVRRNRNDLFTIGTFGFATGGKNFEKIISFAERFQNNCLFRVHLPYSYYCDVDGKEAKELAERLKGLCKRNNIQVQINHDFFEKDELIDWLAANDLNIFLYDDTPGRGISSVTDLAVAAERPLALSDSTMFRHLKVFAPELFLSSNTLESIIANGRKNVSRLKNMWTPKKAVEEIDKIIEGFVADKNKKQTERLNTILNDTMREFYNPHIAEISTLCPDIHNSKIPRANINQGFIKAQVEKFATTKSRILCVGCHQDSAYYALVEKGYCIEAIDPEYNYDLEGFYKKWDNVTRYDLIFSTSVIEHVPDDVQFINRIVDLLAPGGHAVITMDFNDRYLPGMPLPATDERFYTTSYILSELLPEIHNCSLVDCYDWQNYSTDFEHDGVEYSFSSFVFKKELTISGVDHLIFDLNVKNLGLASKISELACSNQGLLDKHYFFIKKIENLSCDLERIYNSRGWRLLSFLYTSSDRLIPKNSFRRKLASILWKFSKPVLRILYKGLKGLRQIFTRPNDLVELFKNIFTFIRRGTKSFLQHIFFIIRGLILRNALAKRFAKFLLDPFPRIKHRFKILSTKSSAYYQPHILNDTTGQNFGNVLFYYVDHTIVCASNSGVQRVTRMLARTLLDSGIDVRFVKWSRKKHTFVYINRKELEHLGNWGGPIVDSHEIKRYPIFRREGEVISVPHGGGQEKWIIVPEVPHLPQTQTIPKTQEIIDCANRLSLKTSFLFYDAIPLKRAELAEDASLHAEYMRSLGTVDVVFPISECARQDLLSFIKENTGNVDNPDSWAQALLLPAENFSLPRVSDFQTACEHENFILCVGSITPHKNQLGLVRAFDEFCSKNPCTNWSLVLVGHVHPTVRNQLFQLLERNNRIKYQGHSSDKILEKYYRKCAFTVFPSVEEGFGLPIVESLWFGKPCICANFGAMGEVGSLPGCIQVDTRNDQAIEEAISGLIGSPKSLEIKYREAISAELKTWSHYVDELLGKLYGYELDRNRQVGTCVSIIIPVHNQIDLTRQCVETILEQKISVPFEIIVIDDASTDGTFSCLSKMRHKIRMARNDKNLRFAGSCNAGALLARGNFLVFLNNDTIPEKGWLEAMLSRYMSDSSIGIVGAKLLYPDRNIQHCGIEFGIDDSTSDLLPTHRLRYVDEKDLRVASPMEFAAVTGACLLISKALFNEVGKFDVDYGMYFEDIDLCLKVHKKGLKVVYEPTATIIHLESMSSDYNLTILQENAWNRFVSIWSRSVADLGPLRVGVPYQSASLDIVCSEGKKRPKLSICITTYNRGKWLALNLKNIFSQLPEPISDVEIIVCDNASTDNTEQIIKPFLNRSDIRYVRNKNNVGMLGNLGVTAKESSGDYVWLIGDDDFILPGAISKVLSEIDSHPAVSLIYLNFSYTYEKDSDNVVDINQFLASSTPIGSVGPDIFGTVAEISTCSENFFTAIYCMVFRRDHALKAYSVNTEGRPFSTMKTCIPTTYYVLNEMMSEPGLWLGQPQIMGNMNASWLSYAPLWILERIPEAHDLAEIKGANPANVDRWRRHNIPGIKQYFQEIFEGHDPLGNAAYFDVSRMLKRLEHLPEFSLLLPYFETIYGEAHKSNKRGAESDPCDVFAPYRTTNH